MIRIFLIYQDTCQTFEMDTEYAYQNVQFERFKQKLIIHLKGQSYTLKNKQFRQVDKYIIGCCFTQWESWYLYPLDEITTFGRSKENDVVISDKMVSLTHCSIIKDKNRYMLSDKQSTNGIFVNGKRVFQAILNHGDQIIIGSVMVYFVSDYVVLNHTVNPLSQVSSAPLNTKKVIEEMKFLKLVEVRKICYEIESPILMEEIKKPSFFSSIGSSLMILVSSMLTGVLVLLFTESSLESMSTMMFSSVSMCLAFLTYGLINRNIMHKAQLKTKNTKEKLYLDYLDQVYDKIQKDRTKQTQLVNQNNLFYRSYEKTTFNYFKNAPFKLMVSLERFKWCDFSYQKASYQDQNHYLYKKRDALIEDEITYIQNLQVIEQNEKVWIRTNSKKVVIETLWQQLCWFCNDLKLKIIWLVDDINFIKSWIDHPYCMVGHKYLVAKNKEECVKLTPLVRNYDQLVFICFNAELISCFSYQENTLIYVSQTKIEFEFDKIFDSIKHDSYDLQKIRKSIQYQKVQENHKVRFIDLVSFDLDKFWDHNQTQLEFEIGNDENKNPILLNLSEAGHGPHGLIAGMTGSGKSEFISSMLMKLVILNPPSLLKYVLVDFKGEAFGMAFREFDHCAGIISNLSHNSMERFSLSMNYEIKKRQTLLKEMLKKNPEKNAHIDVYNQIVPDRPIAHLFVIVDEFAQLKANYPDYLKSMVEMARIGRSLGIHLILSTQKPMGIVDDQIWANANLKVCLKVNSETDSREILHHNQAMYLKNAGDFIIQVTNQEYEKQGRAFYLHDSIQEEKTFEMYDEMGKLVVQKDVPTSYTIYQYLRTKITEHSKQKEWIILPDLTEKLDFNDGLILVDLPHCQSQISMDVKSSVAILTNDVNAVLKTVITRYHDKTIVLCDFYGFEDYVDEVIISQDLLWKKEYFDQNTYLVLHSYDFEKLNDVKCQLIVIVEQCTYTMHDRLAEFDLLLSYKVHDLENHRYFFDSFKISKEDKALVYYQETLCEYIFCQENCSIKRKKRRFDYQNRIDFLIGYDRDEGIPYFWNRKRKMIFCFIQRSIEKKIFTLVNRWKELDHSIEVSSCLSDMADLYILYIPTIKQEEFMIKQFDMDIIWMGLGFMEYSYLIKRSLPCDLSSEMIYWHDNQVQNLKGEICMNN